MNVFFMGRILESISHGRFFRMTCAVALRVVAAIIALAGVVGFVSGIAALGKFGAGASNSIGLGAILSLLLFAVGIYMVVHTIWIRAHDVASLPDGAYALIPISGVCLRLAGEVLACYTAVVGVGAGLLAWLAGSPSLYRVYGYGGPISSLFGYGPSRTLYSLGAGIPFVAGLVAVVGGLLMAFLELAFFYLLSESTGVLVDIAVNIRGLRQSTAFAAVDGRMVGAPAAGNGSAAIHRCAACGAGILTGSRFCEDCGAPVAAA